MSAPMSDADKKSVRLSVYKDMFGRTYMIGRTRDKRWATWIRDAKGHVDNIIKCSPRNTYYDEQIQLDYKADRKGWRWVAEQVREDVLVDVL